ncbi:MAG: hypothetical protein GY935_18015 [Gammaproteobacteria bacterium]|nr:hypothetical protein [Gammaproteobacteria bacterium]
MDSNSLFRKTQSGRSEIEANLFELTQHQRRVLILVNGSNDSAALSKMSLCKDIEGILAFLLSKNLVELVESKQVDATIPLAESKVEEEKTDLREFLCNTLLTYGNRVRVAKLIEEINAVQDIDSLKELVNSWYRAISESPNGMYEADNLKKHVQKMLALEEANGLR